jgi:lipoyl(octanoyl) transferase
MKSFRLIRSGASSAAYNMALDEKIFKRYLEDGISVFRVYRWRNPSFTYGFSQNPVNLIDLSKCATDSVEVVKRMTGGGILFHDDEITYSFICSKSDLGEPQDVFVAYRNICQFLLRFYESLGMAPVFALDAESFHKRCAPHQLCSAAQEKYDIVINGKKIGGNAQKRRRQVIFQHGSVPCRIDWNFVRRYINCLPNDISAYVTTLSDELQAIPTIDILEQKLINAFSSVNRVNFIEEKEAAYETSLA